MAGRIWTLDLIDSDKISLSNLNRQIYALHSAIGRYKVDVARERSLDIQSVTKRRQTPGSVAFVPSVAGLIIAGEVIKDLMLNREC